jgi:Transmembrane adaptor Erv26
MQVIMVIHVFLWIADSLPLPQILFSIFCHAVYLTNFTPAWPLISLSSLSFIGSCILVLADHFVWFFYFSKRSQEGRYVPRRDRHSSDGWILPQEPKPILSFLDIATFFGICVWLVPLFLFLSLSANDNALPTSQGNSDRFLVSEQ